MPQLIVNADDYGYFPGVSRGILALAERGRVTATGILANGPQSREQFGWLAEHPGLDVGVHLNLTWGRPLTSGMRRRLARYGGRFPGKYRMVLGVLGRGVLLREIGEEWGAQIHACQEHGLDLKFINSHEHLHMLPALFDLYCELAERLKIPFLRIVRPEPTASVRGGFRSLVMRLLARGRAGTMRAPRFLGLGPSGRLNLPYLARLFPALEPDGCYELMCHPGLDDPAAQASRRLRAYHDWRGEQSLFGSDDFTALCAAYGVRLVRYRDLDEALV
jgi:hypothetical protein